MDEEQMVIVGGRVGSGLGQLSDTFDMFTAMNGSVKRLSHLRRYSSFRAIWEENVAEHTFYCAFMAWLIAVDLQQCGWYVDRGKVAEIALVHDLEEALTGDIITIFKNSHPDLKKNIKKMGRECAAAMFEEYGPSGDTIHKTWAAQDQRSLESSIVGFADLLCVVAYAREEVLAGNQAFEPVIRDIHRDMRRFRDDVVFGRYIVQIWPNDWAEDAMRTVQGVHTADKYPKVKK